MLKQRVVTAIVLLLILLPALFYPSSEPFCVVALVLIAGIYLPFPLVSWFQNVARLLG